MLEKKKRPRFVAIVFLFAFFALRVSAQFALSAELITGKAEGGKSVAFYLVPASSDFSPTRLPGTIYVFRRNRVLSSAPVGNQREVFGDAPGGDLRQVVLVVVPDGTVTSELTNEAAVLASSFERYTLSGTLLHCPLQPNGSFAIPAEYAGRFPLRSAFNATGVTRYFGLATLDAVAVSPLFEIVLPNGTFRSYFLDTVPGDTGYSPLRSLIRATLPSNDSPVPQTKRDVQALALTERGFVNALIVSVAIPRPPGYVHPRLSGFVDGRVVQFYEFNASRLTTSVANQTGVVPSRMYVLPNQAEPIIDVVPGDAQYNDVWEIYEIRPTVGLPLPVSSVADFEGKATIHPTGSYLNCPVVGETETLADLADRERFPMRKVFHRGASHFCFNFSFVAACTMSTSYELFRFLDTVPVVGNDIFISSPALESTLAPYSPLQWVVRYSVSPQYAFGTLTRASALSLSGTPSSAGRYANRVVVYEAPEATTRTYSQSRTIRSAAFDRLIVEWELVSRLTLDVRITSAYSTGFVAIRFPVPPELTPAAPQFTFTPTPAAASSAIQLASQPPRAHEGLFVIAYMASNGERCVRQFLGTSASPAGMQELTDNVINVSAVTMRATPTAFTVAFTRNRMASALERAASVVSFATKRGPALASCTVTGAEVFRHDSDGAVFVTDFVWESAPLTPPTPPTPAPPTPLPPAATPVPPTPTILPRGFGTVRCGPELTIAWNIDFAAAEIVFRLQLPVSFASSGSQKWVAVGLGSQMSGADIAVLYRHPVTRAVVAEDRKGIANELPALDAHQDVEVVESPAQTPAPPTEGTSSTVASPTTVWSFRRRLDTGDRRTSAQPVPRDALVGRQFSHMSGWATGARVAFFDFGNEPSFGDETSTRTARYYRMVSASGDASSTFQRDLIDVVPGQVGYSDLWTQILVVVPANFAGPEIRAVHNIPSTWAQQPTSELLNCPVGNLYSSARSSAVVPRHAWYRGERVVCFETPPANSQTGNSGARVAPQKAFFFVREGTNETVDAVFEYSLLDVNFTSFVWRQVILVNASFTAGTYTTVGAVRSAGLRVEQRLSAHRNYPFVPYHSVPSDAPTSTPRPSAVDPALLQGYESSKVLHNSSTTNERIVLYWNYRSVTRVLQILMVGYNIDGYVAVGFSNESHTQMSNSDIILGYVDALSATGGTCVRSLYSQFAVGAPSSPATLTVRNAAVTRVGGATLLAFERDFDGRAHGEGLIPSVAQGATSRIIWATQRAPLSHSCTSLDFTPLYHGDSPHGSSIVNWAPTATTVPGAEPTLPPSTNPQILTPQFLVRRNVSFRGLVVPAYCMPWRLPQLLSVATVPSGTMFLFVAGGIGGSGGDVLPPAQSFRRPIIDAYPNQTRTVSGLWKVVYVVVPSDLTGTISTGGISSPAQVASFGWRTFTNSTRFVNCPPIHFGSSVEGRDVSRFPVWPVFYEDQTVHCLMLGYTNDDAAGTLWNVTSGPAAALGLLVVDDETSPFRRAVEVAVPIGPTAVDGTATREYNSAELLVGFQMSPTVFVSNCAGMFDLASHSLTSPTLSPAPAATSHTVQTGFFEGRAVTYLRVPSTRRFSSRRRTIMNPLYVLKRGVDFYAPDAQSAAIVDTSFASPLYSDLWNVVIVDVTTRATSAPTPVPADGGSNTSTPVVPALTSLESLAGFPQYRTGRILNCPIVNNATTFAGAAVSLLSVYYRGTLLTCARFGFLSGLPAALPVVYSIRGSSGVPISSSGDLFSTVPGVSDFSSLQWVVAANLFASPGAPPQSVAALGDLPHTKVELYEVWNVLVLSVATGGRNTTLATLALHRSTGAITRIGNGALMASAPVTSMNDGAVATRPALAALYVFRRALALESDEIDGQKPLIDVGPSEVSYSFLNGSVGYTDTKRVVVVRIPRNYTGGEIASMSALIFDGIGRNWERNTSTGFVAHLFVGVRYEAEEVVAAGNGSGVPAATPASSSTAPSNTTLALFTACTPKLVWYAAETRASLDCGFTREETAVVVTTGPNQTALLGADSLGSRFRTVVSMWASNPFVAIRVTFDEQIGRLASSSLEVRFVLLSALQNDLPSSATSVGAEATAAAVPTALCPAAWKRKFVFRRGASLSSPGGGLLPPVLDSSTPSFSSGGSTLGATIARVYVVDIRDATDLPERIADVTTLLEMASLRCWSMTPTPVAEVGVVFSEQAALPILTGLRVDTVYAGGTRHYFAVSSTVSDAELCDRVNFVVQVVNTAGLFSHYVFPSPITATTTTTAGVALLAPSSRRLVRRLVAADPSTVYLLSVAELAARTTSTNTTAVFHVTSVSQHAVPTPLVPTTWSRRVAWFEGRRIYYYEVSRTAASIAAASLVESALFRFRSVDESGADLGAVGVPVVADLPGQATYTDLRREYHVGVPASAQSVFPTSVAAMWKLVNGGKLREPVATGRILNAPVDHAESTIDARDVYDSFANPRGVQVFPVYCNGKRYTMFSFGETLDLQSSLVAAGVLFPGSAGTPTSPSSAASVSSVVGLVRESGASLGDSTLLSTLSGAAAAFSTRSPLRSVWTATVPNDHIANSVKNVTDLTGVAVTLTYDATVSNIAVVQADQELNTFFYDDVPITAVATPVIWAMGEMERQPVSMELAKHTARGTIASVNFFTGEATSQSGGVRVAAIPGVADTLQVGTGFRLSWGIGVATPPSIPSSSARRVREAFYSLDETEISFTFVVGSDVWAAIGITKSGGMEGADMMLVYATEYFPPGRSVAVPYVHVSDRKCQTSHTLPGLDAKQNVSLVRSSLVKGGGGYEITIRRPLNTGDKEEDFPILDEPQTLIFAYGPFNRAAGHPLMHSGQGSVVLNLINTRRIKVPQHGMSTWYIAVLVAALAAVLLLGLVSRLLPPGPVLYLRPLQGILGDLFSLMTNMSLAEWAIFLTGIGLGAMWIAGHERDFARNAYPYPALAALGAGAQFFMYFMFIPTMHYNPVLLVFKTYYHRARRFAHLLGGLALLFSWIHGIAMLVVLPSASFSWSLSGNSVRGLAGFIAVVFLSVLALVQAHVLPVGTAATHRLQVLCVLAGIVFVHIHVPSTVYGMIATFLFFCIDISLRAKDRLSRVGTVRSYVSIGTAYAALELQVASPWHRVLTRPFTAVPGQFVILRLSGSNETVPLTISSRVLQDPEADHCTFTVHVKVAPRRKILMKIAEAAAAGTLAGRGVAVEGPHGGMTLRLKWYKTLMIVGGGIGATSAMALLEALTFQPDFFTKETSLRKVVLVWVVRTPETLSLFANEIAEALKAPKAFTLSVYFYVTSQARNPIPAAVYSEVGPATGAEERHEPLPQRADGVELSGELSKHPVFREVPVLVGRPDWLQLFAAQKMESMKQGETRMAVYANAPPEMTTAVQGACADVSSIRRFQVHVEAETYR